MDFQLLNRKKNGNMNGFIFPLYLFLFTAIFVCFVYASKIISFTRTTVEDGLMAATLASAWFQTGENINELVIDEQKIEFYYDIFCSSLKENLMLDDTMTPKQGTATDSLICSSITIEQYSFYSVREGKVYQTTRTSGLDKEQYIGDVGKAKAPDGSYINNPTVYSKISFVIINEVSKETRAVKKDCTVDIAQTSE